MSHGPSDLESRVSTLERQMRVYEVVVANQRVLDALRRTQLDQAVVLAEHSVTFAQHATTLTAHGRKLDALDAKMDSRFEEVLALLRQRPES